MSINGINGEISESFCSDVADFILLKMAVCGLQIDTTSYN